MEKMKVTLVILSLLGISVLVYGEGDEPYVSFVTPHSGSLAGNTKITIFGGNFASDQSTTGAGNENNGNKVILSSLSDIGCEVFREDTNDHQIVCYSPSGMEPGVPHYVRVKVNDVDIKEENYCGNQPNGEDCSYMANWWNTPVIRNIEPFSGIPTENIVTMTGRVVSPRFGSDQDISANGRKEKLLRVYGPGSCPMKKPDGTFYGVYVEEDSMDGYIACKPNETFVGITNFTFMIEAPFGRSYAQPELYRVSANEKLYMYQYFTDITEVTPSELSTEGGGTLRVYGRFFERGGTDDSTYDLIRVLVGDVECEVTNVVKDKYLECIVGKKPAELPSHNPGGRGVNTEYWPDGTYPDLEGVKAAPPSDNSKHFDMMRIYGDEINAMQTRTRGIFTPPKSGDWAIQVKATYQAKLYIDEEEVAESTGSWDSGPRISMTEGQHYRLMVVAMGPSAKPGVDPEMASVEVRGLFYDEKKFTESWTGNAIQEEQIIRKSSVVTQDVQVVKFSAGQIQSPQFEVQRVCVEGGSYNIRLGMFGTWTESVGVDAADEVGRALNNLPLFDGDIENFSVAQDGDRCVEITINSPRGDFPDFDVLGEDLYSFEVTNPGGQSGVPDNDLISVMMGGRPSKPFSLSNGAFADVEAAFDSLFEATCPRQFYEGNFLYESFEDDPSIYRHGDIENNVEPFCDKNSLKNPRKLYPWKADDGDVSLKKMCNLFMMCDFHVCFAYSGLENAQFEFKYRNENGATRWDVLDVDPLEQQAAGNIWSYACVNPQVTIGEGDFIEAKLTGEYVEDAFFYIDAVFIGGRATLTKGPVSDLRLRPATPNPSQQVLIDHTEVTYDADNDEYSVRLFPLYCASDFGLFEIINHGGEALTGDSGVTIQSGGSAAVTVNRVDWASPPVEGTFRVAFQGQESGDLSASMTTKQIKDVLQGIQGTGLFSVELSKDSNCANSNHHVKFITQAGNQDLMQISYKDMLAPPTADIEMVAYRDGHLRYDPLAGDLLSTDNDSPQVRVFVNSIPCQCSGDCSLQWSEAATPSITSLSSNQGWVDGTLEIFGDKFSETPEANTVLIGNAPCVVTDATTGKLTCTIGSGSGQNQPVSVNVAGKGYASGTATFSYTWTLNDFNPKIGSPAGGQIMYLDGNGLPPNLQVYLGDQECRTISVTPTLATVITSAYSSTLESDIDVGVEVRVPAARRRKRQTAGSTSQTASQPYTISPSATARILTVNTPEALSVKGGESVTITVNNMGSTVVITVGDAEISDYTDTESGGVTTIQFQSPQQSPGQKKLCINIDGNGCASQAQSQGAPMLVYKLSVTDTFPSHGSVLGGTILTITGEGFGTVKEDVEVRIGSHTCIVQAASGTQLICQLDKTTKVEVVTNQGDGGAAFTHYAFDREIVHINVGDTIEWQWSAAEYVKNVVYGVYQTQNESSTDLVPNGIYSGLPTRSGKYRHQFTLVGTYNIWSGPVNEYRSFRGKVIVSDKLSSAEKIVVKVHGQEAQYSVGGSVNTVPEDPCSVTSAISTNADPELPDSEHFYFILSWRFTPVVDSFNFEPAYPAEGYEGTVTTSSVINVIGKGFATDTCAIDVFLLDGDDTCSGEVLSTPTPTSTKFAFKLHSDCTLPAIGRKREISVLVKNRGDALLKMIKYSREVAALPSITRITPNTGSTAGYTPVVIEGTGFFDVDRVEFNGEPAEYFEVINDTHIECVTPKSQRGPVTVANGNAFPGVCDIKGGEKCDFLYRDILTPIVNTINPVSINTSSGTAVTLNGEKFGTNDADIQVSFGGEVCVVTYVDDGTIECTSNGIPAGNHQVDVRVSTMGKASTTQIIRGIEVVNTISPGTGSENGGLVLTITGHGFHRGEGTTITVDGTPCPLLVDAGISELKCELPAHAVGTVKVTVAVNSDVVNFPEMDFEYTSLLNSVDIAPKSSVAGSVVTINGANFGTVYTAVSVKLDSGNCVVKSDGFSDTSFTCKLDDNCNGNVEGYIMKDDYGKSNLFQLSCTPQLDSVTPTTGDAKGNQRLTLQGKGLSEDMEVHVCGSVCPLDESFSHTATELVCITPAGQDGDVCDVNLVDKGISLTGAYTLEAGRSPIVTGINPRRGGTGGGFRLTISGSGFGDVSTDVAVTIDDRECEIDSDTFADGNIECFTPPHTGRNPKTEVVVTKEDMRAVGDGDDALDYWYIDEYSSAATWGGLPPPTDGELVVIPEGQTILLDDNTAVLKLLLIDGGILMFDCGKPVELKAHNILIVNGGKLEIGTEDNPCLSKSIITLYGHHRDKKLPVFGSKVLANYGGDLEMHGKPINRPWTQLSETANKDASVIKVFGASDWEITDEIVIATTGDRLSQKESEKRTITGKSTVGDITELTLDKPLAYKHTGVTETYMGPGKREVIADFRAEVALLTRSILVRGNEEADEWKTKIEKCPDGFNTGEHAIQTCFQGRFGEEIGSSKYGQHIMVHNKKMNTQDAQMRLQFVEIAGGGQAFHLGRYPIHFHVNGNMSKSYVKGCAVHKSNNRGINIHNTHATHIAWNVIYDINGGGYFTEDGIEELNVFEFNLGIFVKSSDTLSNDDLNAAAFWVTNAYNIYRNNTAVGGTNNGFWYRANEHTDGPSFDPSSCPRRKPLLENIGNTVKSQGEFGLWTFEEWQPQIGGQCHASPETAEPAKFFDFTVINCRKGVETVKGSSIQFIGLLSVQNSEASVQGVRLINTPKRNPDKSAMIKDALLVGHANSPDLRHALHGVTDNAIVFPYGGGYWVENVKFLNFDGESTAPFHGATKGLCPFDCAGYGITVRGLETENTDLTINFRYEFEAYLEDLDGSLTGQTNHFAIPWSATLPPSCVKNDTLKAKGGRDVAVCPPDVKVHRFAFNNIYPGSLAGQDVLLENTYGRSLVPYRKKRFTHKLGWMGFLGNGMETTLSFVESGADADTLELQAISNVSYSAMISGMTTATDCVIVKIRAYEEPDRFSFKGGNDPIEKANKTSLDCDTAQHGEWIFLDGFVFFAVKGPSDSPGEYEDDFAFDLSFYNCFYDKCIPPKPVSEMKPEDQRPEKARQFHETDIWVRDAEDANHVLSAVAAGNAVSQLHPTEHNDVTIAADDWIVLTKNLLDSSTNRRKRSTSQNVIRLGKVMLFGTLEISALETDAADQNYNIEANAIIVKAPGRLIVGWPDEPFLGTCSITLRGTKDSPYFENPAWSGPTVGAKALAAFGGLDLHGKDHEHTWTNLAFTAVPGDTEITVTDSVSDWDIDSEIIITTTSNKVSDTERRFVQAVSASGTTITLNKPLDNRHIATTEDADGITFEFAAVVGLLSRNIVIQGNEEESVKTYGGRVFVGLMQEGGEVFQGFARVTNTEMKFMGQDGFTEDADPRAALAYLLAHNNENRPSYVRKNSFHDLYNSAVVTVGSKNIEIADNVIHKPLGPGIKVRSPDSIVTHNLVDNTQFQGAYNGRYEVFNFIWDAGIDMWNAEDKTLQGNHVSGSERAGYHLSGDECDSITVYDESTSNVAVSNMVGVLIFPSDTMKPEMEVCNAYSNIKMWKNEIGFYYNNRNSVKLSNMVFADNDMAVFPMVFTPNSIAHVCEHKFVNLENSVMFGFTTASDCTDDATAAELENENYYRLAGPANVDCRARRGPDGQRLGGMTHGSYSASTNKAPGKPCFAVQAPTAMCGSTTVDGVTFKNFGRHGSCQPSYAFAGNPANDDGQHPMHVKNSRLQNVDDEFIAYFPRPNLRKIEPGDCVDFDCDAMKNLMIRDMDGSILGSPGALLAGGTAFEYNGDRRRGIGDKRIPHAMQTDLDGYRIPFDEIYDDLGIPRAKDSCTTYNRPTYTDNQGQYFYHKCTSDVNYKMLAIESKDSDTMERRLSPVAFREKVAGKSYLHMVNGPQDHGCCSGYNCNRRLSLFHTIVAAVDTRDVKRRKRATGQALTEGYVDIYFTSDNPNTTRAMFMAPDDFSCIVMSIYYNFPNRVDVYVEHDDGSTTNKLAINGRYVNEKYIPDYIPEDEITSRLPTCAHDVGTNFIHIETRTLHVVLKGKEKLLLKRHIQVILQFGFPSMSPDEFYKDGLIENLAAMLNVQPNKVRIVKIVSAASISGRKKRATSGSFVVMELGDPPSSDPDAPSTVDLLGVAGKVFDACQLETIDGLLATETECESVDTGDTTYTPVTPHSLRFYQEPSPEHEGVLLKVQPKLRAYDASGNAVENLGLSGNPWKLTVTIKSGTGHADADLGGTATIPAVGGWFNFTDLFISHSGLGYILEFDISMPSAAADLNLAISSAAFDVKAVPITAAIRDMTSDAILENAQFSFSLELRDATTNMPIPDLNWRGHTFDVNCTLPSFNEHSILTGDGIKSFDPAAGKAQFDGLALSGFGPTYLECHIVSTPEEFDFYSYPKVYVRGTTQTGTSGERSEVFRIRFLDDFSTTLQTDTLKAQLEQIVIHDIVKRNPYIVVTNVDISEGSILITFTVEGATGNVTSMTNDLCSLISEGQSYTLGSTTLTLDSYMTVDGQESYGSTCEASEKKKDGLHPAYIALIVVAVLLVIAIVVVVLLWKFKFHPQTQTHEIRNTRFAPDNGKTVYLGRGLTQEGTFTSLSSRSGTLYHSHVNVDLRNSPVPAIAEKAPYPDSAHLAPPPSDTKASPIHRSPSPVRPWKY